MSDNNIDLKILLALTNAYENLYEKGEITEKQLDRILSLLDHYHEYSPAEFKERVSDIFD